MRNIRYEKRMTQDRLANRLGISQNAYSKIEMGDTELTLARLLEIMIILEVPVEMLLEWINAEALSKRPRNSEDLTTGSI
ncbi:MAG: helix-turn-helix transcriptional regulator [Mucilaginibacter sp.]|nr:helix-turn-helix transcriptional regulator [Mucilaginibacter sp.]